MEKSKTHKFFNNPWTITIGGTVIGSIIVSLIIDSTKNKPLLSTIVLSLNWIYTTIIKLLIYTIPVYMILLIVFVLILILLGLIYIKDTSNKINSPVFINYTTDKLKVFKWSWHWHYNTHIKKWQMVDLTIHCPNLNCDTKMLTCGSYGSYVYYLCPRCNYQIDSTQRNFEEIHIIEALIFDNIDRMGDNKPQIK